MKRLANALAAPCAVAVTLLGMTAPALAFETDDGRFQLHGYYQMQLRGISANWNDQFDLTQWYNILNLEFELDLAPDGFEPLFDSASAYVRTEVRFDCIYYGGCGMISSINTYGNHSRDLPGRLSGARRRLSAGALPVSQTLTEYFTAPTDQPDGGETRLNQEVEVSGDRILPSNNPEAIGDVPPFSLFANQAGLDRYRGLGPTLPEFNSVGNPDLGENLLLLDDPYPYIFDDDLTSIHATLINGLGGGGFGLPVSTLLPWRPKDWSNANALLADKTNPFDSHLRSPQLQAVNYNRQMFREISCLLNPDPGTTCLPDGQRVEDSNPFGASNLDPNSELDEYVPGDMESYGPNGPPTDPVALAAIQATWFNNRLREGLGTNQGLPTPPTQEELLSQAKANALIAYNGEPYGFTNFFNPDPIEPLLASPKGFGALPMRPIPCLANGETCVDSALYPNLSATGENAAQGLYIPTQALRRALDSGKIKNSDYKDVFHHNQLSRAFNHGWSQSRTYELKEAYLDLETFDSRLWMRIGKQSIVWGKTELFRTTDNFNPQDLSLATLPSLEESRIPLLAFRGVYSLYDVGPLEDVRFEVALNLDDFQGVDFGTCGEPYAPDIVCTLGLGALAHGTTGIGVAGIELPPSPLDDVKGLQGGVRLEFRHDRFSFALSDYYGYSVLPHINLMTEFDRNVDLDSGRMRTVGSFEPCTDGTQPACLQRGPSEFNNADYPSFPAFYPPNEDRLSNPANALENHPVNQQLYAFTCAATTGSSSLDPAACALNLFNSTARAQGIPIGQLTSSLLAGGSNASLLLAVGTCPSPCLADPGFSDPTDPNFAPPPLVGLNRDGYWKTDAECAAAGGFFPCVGDLRNENFGPAVPPLGLSTPCQVRTELPGGFQFWDSCSGTGRAYFSGAGQNYQGLSQHLTAEQEALLGCGPFFGIHCDLQGVDLLNAEASTLLQSFVGFDGTTCQNGDPFCWRTDTTRPQPGTLNFLTGAEGVTASADQILGGPVGTRWDRNSQRAGLLPGSGRTVKPVELGCDPRTDPTCFYTLNPAWDATKDGCSLDTDLMPLGTRGYCGFSIAGLEMDGSPGNLNLDHPFATDALGNTQLFASELAALSWNLMILLATVDGDFSVENRLDPDANVALGYTDGGCTYITPQNCGTVRSFLGTAGLTRNTVKAGGNGRFGRRTFIWSGGSEVSLGYLKRNVLGFSMDFAEDTTKSNWAFEFSWINKQRVSDSDSWSGTTDVQDFNLSVSVDRPTFIRFLNTSRTFFMNLQMFFQYRDGYKKSMSADGPFNFLFTYAVQTGYMQDRLLPSFVFLYDVNSDSGGTIPQITYRISSNFSLSFGVAFFWGSPSWNPMPVNNTVIGNRGGDRPYQNVTYNGVGIARDRDEVFFRLRYTF